MGFEWFFWRKAETRAHNRKTKPTKYTRQFSLKRIHSRCFALSRNLKQTRIFYADTRIARKGQKALRSPRKGSVQEVSAASILLKDSQAICSAVSRWMTTMGPLQRGQSQAARSSTCPVSILRSDSVFAPINSLQTESNAARRRFAMYPKKRMRTNPRGSVCSKNRRRNSSTVTVISFCWFPWTYLSLWQILEAISEPAGEAKLSKVVKRITVLLKGDQLLQDAMASFESARHLLVHKGKYSRNASAEVSWLKVIAGFAISKVIQLSKEFPDPISLADYFRYASCGSTELKRHQRSIEAILKKRESKKTTWK
jgi:hypothetical protein